MLELNIIFCDTTQRHHHASFTVPATVQYFILSDI